MTNYFTEMVKLAIGLHERGISYEIRPLFDGMQILCDGWDAICHEGSYGHEIGLIEVMGLGESKDGDDVIGWLTAEDVLRLVDEVSA